MKLSNFVLIIFALFLALATTSATAGNANTHTRPFFGTLAGEAEFPLNDNCDGVTGAPWQTLTYAAGKMSHMGRSEYLSAHCSTLDGSALVGGEATIVAANGDEIWLAYTGKTIAGPPIITIIAEHIIIGGTGRFENATGVFTGYVFVTFMGMEAPSMPVEFVFAGMITY